MNKTKARTPAEYLAAQPEARRRALSKVRGVIRRRLPRGYREVINWGMITYEVPLSRFPKTYNGQPLCYASLGAQKNHLALYLMGAYASAQGRRLAAGFKKAGKKLDMGKSCIRFQTADDLALEAIGDVVASLTVEKYLGFYEATRPRSRKKNG
jgi:uncharacterized protein YdhG (YjbR/CyaY superfamily)